MLAPFLVEWPLGLGRAWFSLSIGLLIHKIRPRVNLPLPILVLLLIAAMSIPTLGPVWITELIFICAVFPLVVAGGVHAGRGAVSRFAGRLSYPLYAVHYPFVQMFGNLARAHHLHGIALGLWMILEAATAILVAYLAERWIDTPARGWRARRRGTGLASGHA